MTKYTVGDPYVSSRATQGQPVESGMAAKLDGRHKTAAEKEDAQPRLSFSQALFLSLSLFTYLTVLVEYSQLCDPEN